MEIFHTTHGLILIGSPFLGVCGSVQDSSFSGHCLCCFSCVERHWTAPWERWLWVSGVQGAPPICLLFAPEHKAEWWFANHRKMGNVHAPKSFVIWSHWRRKFLGRDSSVLVPREDTQQLPPIKFPQGVSSFPRKLCVYHPFYSCRAFSIWVRPELFNGGDK